MTALTNLLPGIRDLRAPLAAGYIWLLGLWLATESEVPRADGADGLLGSLYRLGEGLSAIGLGVVASFVAYVLGSLSTSLFAAPSSGLRRLSFLSRRLKLDPFSNQGRAALGTLSRNTRLELERVLSMSGTDVEDLFAETLTKEDVAPQSGSTLIRMRSGERHLLLRGGGTPRNYEGEQEATISQAIVRDLDTIATTRLLGRDQELYSAVDRLRAETEFRRAIVPPMLFTAAVIIVRTDLVWQLLVAAAVAALSLGLLADAARLERRANDLLLDVVTDDRVQSPTLERLRDRASVIVSRTAADDTEQAASRLAAAIKRTIRRLERVGVSDVTLAHEARDDAKRAMTLLHQTESGLDETTMKSALYAVQGLAALADDWIAAMDGAGLKGDVHVALAEAEHLYQQFLYDAKQDVAKMREPPPSPSPST